MLNPVRQGTRTVSVNHVTGGTGIAALLPEDIEVDEGTSDIPLDTLMPQECAMIARAVPTPRAEFTTVRCCARQVLFRLEHPSVPILAGKNREPVWPDRVVGSLMHLRRESRRGGHELTGHRLGRHRRRSPPAVA
ncbi:hypothetical protein [Streptomyces sp. NPDC050988]|uniref:hypothetical protein n=1 Tax=Streptomyces sp. NPDC050988 TaxID=3365637 RepID=UPI0037A27E51